MDSARATMKELGFGIFDRIERTSGSPNLEELWGSLTADQARRSFDLFATKIMPEFMKGPAAAGR